MISQIGSERNQTGQIQSQNATQHIGKSADHRDSAAASQTQQTKVNDGVTLSDEVKSGDHIKESQNDVNVAALTGKEKAEGAGAETTDKGQAAVDLARKYVNQRSAKIKGKMPNFTAAGGRDNNCADFVSSALKETGKLDSHQIRVKELEKALQANGYTQVPPENTQPGDVWIGKDRKHTELVSEPGGAKTIGSNNHGHNYQTITERDKDINSGVYYQQTEKK
jgi:hypothetical protein